MSGSERIVEISPYEVSTIILEQMYDAMRPKEMSCEDFFNSFPADVRQKLLNTANGLIVYFAASVRAAQTVN